MKNTLFCLALLFAGNSLFAQPLQTLYHKNGKKYIEGHWTFTKRSLMSQITNVESTRETNQYPYDAAKGDLYQPDAEEQFRRTGQPLYYLDPAEFLSLQCEGPVTYWYSNGAKQMEISYKKGVPNGPFAQYYADSRTVLQKGNLTNGMPDGPWTYYYKSGKPFYNGTYKAYSQEELARFWAREESDFENRSDGEMTNNESLYTGGENDGLDLTQPFFRFYGMFLPAVQKQGRFQFWDAKGRPWAEMEFESDRPVGTWKVWHEGFKGPALTLEWEKGKISFITDTAGKRRSRAEAYRSAVQRAAANNPANRNPIFEPGIVDPSQQNSKFIYVEPPPPPAVFTYIEKMPEFKGNLNDWLAQNLRYPPAAKEALVDGRVVVKFVVQKDGSVANATVEKGVSPELDAEALRLINAMPAWEPGQQNGKPVPVDFRVPVKFRLP